MGSRLADVSSDSQIRQSIMPGNAPDTLSSSLNHEGSAVCIAMGRQTSARLL
jgi:hypothetical protein